MRATIWSVAVFAFFSLASNALGATQSVEPPGVSRPAVRAEPNTSANTQLVVRESSDGVSTSDWLGFAVNILVALFTAGTVAAAVLATRATRSSAETSVVHGRKVATVEHVSSRLVQYRRLITEVGDLPQGDLDEVTWSRLLELIGMWEHTAAGVTAGVFDIEVLNKMTGGNILRTYREYARFIRTRRRANPRVYDQLEILVDKLLAMQSSNYVVDRAALRRLRQSGVRAETVRAVRTLESSAPYTYHRLLRGLIATGTENEKTLVMSAARRASWIIKPARLHERPEIVSLFETIQENTSGRYPPLRRTQDAGSVEAWLGDDPATLCFAMRDDSSLIGYVEIERIGTDPNGAVIQPSQYWRRAFADQTEFQSHETMDFARLAVVKRLVVDPRCSGTGRGRILLRYAIQVIQFSLECIPALVVLKTQEPAIALYESEGATRIGEFRGHPVGAEPGGEMVSYVF